MLPSFGFSLRVAFGWCSLIMTAVAAPPAAEIASLNPQLVWQRTSPPQGETDGPVLYQIIFRSNATPGHIPTISGSFTLTNSLLSEDAAGTSILVGNGNTFSISSNGIITFASGQTFPGTAGGGVSITVNNGLTANPNPMTGTATLGIANGGVTATQIGSGAAVNGQVLTADGSGGAGWQAPAASGGAGGVNGIQEFTSNGTFMVPTGITHLLVQVYGDGGGGGGGSSVAANTCGGSGGDGAYTAAVIQVTSGTAISVVIGSGGAAGAQGSDGGSGAGTSLVGSGMTTLISSGGGGGGKAGTAVADGAGGSGGSASALGSITRNGQDGTAGISIPNPISPSCLGGTPNPGYGLPSFDAGGGVTARSYQFGGSGAGGGPGTPGQVGHPGYVLIQW